MTSAIITAGSIGALAQQNGKSLAESFMSADGIIVIDISGSMDTHDAQGGRSRYEVACDELKSLQRSNPGKWAIIEFCSDVAFIPGGVPSYPHGMTDLTKALEFVHVADRIPGMRFFVISDGEPNNESSALARASKFKNRIDTIFVGPEGGAGRSFLARLAAASGGQSVTSAQAHKLADSIKLLTA